MLNLFKRNKPTINSISFPLPDWDVVQDRSNIKQLINPEEAMALSVNYFGSKPDLPSEDGIESLRDFYRSQISAQKGGLIQVDRVKLKGYDVIKTIFKIPQEPTGMMYLGSLTIPFEKYSYVIKIQAHEIGATGQRENVTAMNLLNKGEISLGKDGYQNWSYDPYDSKIRTVTRMNKSEKASYDSDFPSHPLSQTRKLLAQIEAEIEFNEALEKIKKFYS